MKSAKKRLTARELTVMNAIWDIGEGAGTSQIVKKLYEWYGEKLTPQAIGVYIDKLQRKEFITVTKPGNYYKLYEPRITKEQYMHEEVETQAGFWNMSTARYGIMALSGSEKITKEEADELRKLLDDID